MLFDFRRDFDLSRDVHPYYKMQNFAMTETIDFACELSTNRCC